MKLAEADITSAIEKKMDRSKWETWKFSDLVENIVEKVVPKECGLEHYIGLKHLDSGSLHIRRFGESASIEGDKLKIYKGDFIFAKRNSYLKRVAIAKFDAVASAHALVLRAKPENVLPEFLPFFLLSEKFWQRAIEISVGSLSPTINWRVLAKQEFLLPPKAQQAEIAELLWAMDNVVQKESQIIEELQTYREVKFVDLVNNSDGKTKPLSEFIVLKKEKSAVPHERDRHIGLEHVASGAFECRDFGESKEAQAQCNLVDNGDLCYSKLRPYLDKAFLATFDAVSTTELLIYDTVKMSKEYVLYHLHSKKFIDYISGKGFGTKMPRVSHKIIGEYHIKEVTNEDEVLEKMEEVMSSLEIARTKLSVSISLQKSLTNQVF